MTYNTPAADLDLAIRAYLMGWQLLYFHHIQVPTRVSPSYARLRRRLYRQAAGQAALWRHYAGACRRGLRGGGASRGQAGASGLLRSAPAAW
jgi:hypothetical protein